MMVSCDEYRAALGFSPAPLQRGPSPARTELRSTAANGNGGVHDWQTKLMADLNTKYAKKETTAADSSDSTAEAVPAGEAAEESEGESPAKKSLIKRIAGKVLFWRK